MEDLVEGVARMILSQLTFTGNREKYTPFHAGGALKIGIYDYLYRLMAYGKMSKEALITSGILMKRVKGVVLDETTVHRLILASLVVSVKMHDDIHETNASYDIV